MDIPLKVTGLRAYYPAGVKGRREALHGLNIELRPGEIFGLLGPNGAGKTTFIKSIVGLMTSVDGEIAIFGLPPSSAKARERIGYMSEIATFHWFMTAEETLRMFGALSGLGRNACDRRIGEVLKRVGLDGSRHALIGKFSKGMHARLNLAQAILHKPDLVILDEPFSGLDPVGRIDMRNILKELKDAGKTVLLSSHELSEAELICDTVCVMRGGSVLEQGPLGEVIAAKGGHSLESFFLSVITR